MKIIDVVNGNVIRDDGVDDGMVMYVNAKAWEYMNSQINNHYNDFERKWMYAKQCYSKRINRIEII